MSALSKPHPTLRYTFLQGSYWACYCCIMTFSSVYLLAQGFSNAQIGVLISISGILATLLQPLVSRGADRLKKLSLRQFCALLISLQLVVGGLLFLLRGQLLQQVLYGLLIILVQLLMPLCSALGMACLNAGFSLNFGVARGAGSVAFGLVSAGCGQLVLVLGARSIPLAMTALHLLFLLSVLAFRFHGNETSPADPTPEVSSHKPHLGQYRQLVWVLVGSTLLFISHNLLNTFAFQIVQPLGGDSGAMGTTLFLQSVMELPVMFLFGWLLTKCSSRFWLQLSGVGFFLHALGAWLAPNMGVMYAIQIFEMPGYALFALASVYFVNETAPPDQRVQGQAWFTMCATLGSVLASFTGGFLLDLWGAGALLAFSTLTGGIGMVLLWVLLGKGRYGDTPSDQSSLQKEAVG